MPETMVLAPVSKELRSHDSHADSKKKALKTKNQPLFLDQWENWGCRENRQPKICKDRQIQRITAKDSLPEAKVAGA